MSVDVKTWKKINVLLSLSLGGVGKKKKKKDDRREDGGVWPSLEEQRRRAEEEYDKLGGLSHGCRQSWELM